MTLPWEPRHSCFVRDLPSRLSATSPPDNISFILESGLWPPLDMKSLDFHEKGKLTPGFQTRHTILSVHMVLPEKKVIVVICNCWAHSQDTYITGVCVKSLTIPMTHLLGSSYGSQFSSNKWSQSLFLEWNLSCLYMAPEEPYSLTPTEWWDNDSGNEGGKSTGAKSVWHESLSLPCPINFSVRLK